jgi:hypothetical protein
MISLDARWARGSNLYGLLPKQILYDDKHINNDPCHVWFTQGFDPKKIDAIKKYYLRIVTTQKLTINILSILHEKSPSAVMAEGLFYFIVLMETKKEPYRAPHLALNRAFL